ncbi:hypothetical protein D8M06_03975 [Oceanobacillus halophilus]|uniref:DUF945 family protein n=1 Tax=Oceanobacillus halophilus TaxID=930130 RepID=A0A495AEA6_9BACI|nr:hypothetical protein D8M06_03975 [Oceanobacillus halophilus]
MIAIAIVAVLVIGGSVAAFVISNNASPKQNYFLAEKNTLDYLEDKMKERYEPELEWSDQSYENPTEQTLELSAEYSGPTGSDGYQTVDPAQFINNSSISITAQADMESKQLASDISLDFSGMKIDGLSAYVTDEKVMLGLPFIEEYLQVMDKDLGPLLHELDPMTFTGEETLELDSLFEGNSVISEVDMEYLKTEYGEMIYKELPDDAFSSSEETIDVNGESLNAEKIELHLSEQQVIDLLTTILEKMESDEKLKDLLKEQLAAGQVGGPALNDEMDLMITEFETGIKEIKDGIQDFQITDGFLSTIWIYNDMVAQRDLKIELGPNPEELVSFGMTGSQLLTDTSQTFTYDLDFADPVSSGTMNITGDLSWEDNQATDSIKLTFGEYNLSYEGHETLEDGTRDFERVFSYNDSMTGGSLNWDGFSTYNKDQVNSENHFSVETDDLSNIISLQLLVDGKLIDSVTVPSDDNVRDLGGMSANELMDYFELELTPNFQQWLFGLMSGGAGF